MGDAASAGAAANAGSVTIARVTARRETAKSVIVVSSLGEVAVRADARGLFLASARYLCHHNIAMSISDVTKKRGRPISTGKGMPITVRLQPDQLAALDTWIAKQPDKPSRPEAMRRVLAEKLF